MERSTELHYLEYFHGAADFGPAEEDVRRMLQDNFERITGMLVPEGFRIRDDD